MRATGPCIQRRNFVSPGILRESADGRTWFAIAFLLEFTVVGLSGVAFATVPVDWQMTDTYFVVAQVGQRLHWHFAGHNTHNHRSHGLRTASTPAIWRFVTQVYAELSCDGKAAFTNGDHDRPRSKNRSTTGRYPPWKRPGSPRNGA